MAKGVSFSPMTEYSLVFREMSAEPEIAKQAMDIALCYVKNAIEQPRFRSAPIPRANARFRATLGAIPGGGRLLQLAGFRAAEVEGKPVLLLDATERTTQALHLARGMLEYRLSMLDRSARLSRAEGASLS
jgi:hypothetical protein